MAPVCVNTLIQSIQEIRSRLISSPLSDTLTKTLESEQESLRVLLEQAALIDIPEDRKIVKDVIDGFAKDLQERLTFLQSHVNDLVGTATQTQRFNQRQKAYQGISKLF